MSDIVERLNRGVDTNYPPDRTDAVMIEAADEIERLREEAKGAFVVRVELQRVQAELAEARDQQISAVNSMLRAEQALAAERERCARVADKYSAESAFCRNCGRVATNIAAAIRKDDGP